MSALALVLAGVLAGFFCLAIFAGPNANAAAAGEQGARGAPGPSAPASPDQIAATASSLTQVSAGTWTTTVFVDTGVLCPVPVSFSLLTTKPYSSTAATSTTYLPARRCGRQQPSSPPVTEVVLTFTPSPGLPAVPQSAAVALTPSPAGLAAGVVPVDLPVTVRRAVSVAQYVWIPVLSGLGLAVALVVLTMALGVSRGGGTVHMHRTRFWRMPLYASSAWSFGDSWATNITAVGTVTGAVLAASGSIAEVIPGVELGRFGLLIAVAGGITVIAPLLFGLLNYPFRSVDPTTSGVAVITLPEGTGTGTGEGAAAPDVRIAVPASGSITVLGPVELASGQRLNAGATLDIPAGAMITVSPSASGDAGQPVVALPGTDDIVVTAGQRVRVSVPLAIPANAGVPAGTHAGARTGANAGAPADDPADDPPAFPKDTPIDMPAGARISFLGTATLTLPAGASVRAPAVDPDLPPRSFLVKYQREFAIPRGDQTVAAQMWTMLAASCLTVFGIGAEIAIVGWVLGYDLAVAPRWARDSCLIVAIAAALLVLGYGVTAIRALAQSRKGTVLSGPSDSSFML